MIFITHKEATVKAGIGAMLAGNCNLPLISLDQSQFQLTGRATVITDYDHGMQITLDRRMACIDDLKIVIVTNRIREWEIRNAVDHGINGILTHDCDAKELSHTIAHLQGADSYLSRCITGRAHAAMQREALTSREQQVLHFLGKGLCNKLIARALGIAEVTVKIHLGNLMMKLGATSRTQAIVMANILGLLKFDFETTDLQGKPVTAMISPSQKANIDFVSANYLDHQGITSLA